MFTPTLTRLLASLDPSLVWVHEHTAVCTPSYTADITTVTQHYVPLGYIIRAQSNVLFIERVLQRFEGSRLEIQPYTSDFVPHEAIAFRTYNDYIRAHNIIERDSRFKKHSNGGDMRVVWTMYSYEEGGETYHVQFLWRKEPVFPNLPWPEPPTTE